MGSGRPRAEPFRVKVVEPLRLTTREEREEFLKKAGYNVFHIPAEYVCVDLLTDSGTGAMSDNQWAGMMLGDESYAGCRSFYNFQASVRDIFGYEYVMPTHQGRAAENILMISTLKDGQYVVGNMLFDSTAAHIGHKGGVGVELPIPEGLEPTSRHPFKGNMDLEKLENFLREHGPEKVAFVLVTVTCNNNGGQPVSMENIRRTREIAGRYGVPLFFDAARYAENVYFIKVREPGYANKSTQEIAREMFSYGDGCTMSSKKTALVNIGGFLAFRSKELYQKALQWLILFEGFATYGGLAGRDLEALARGLYEGLDEAFLAERIGQVEYLGARLREAGIPIVEPPGGHAIYIDAKQMLPHIPQSQFPADALSAALYLEAGVRTIGLGALAFTKEDPRTGETIYPELELTRLAIPRRVYSDRHMDYVADSLAHLFKNREKIRGLRILEAPPLLRHFLSVLQPV